MRILFFDNSGRRVNLFEGTLASDFLWCLSRALSEPHNISSHQVLSDMNMIPSLRRLLEYTPGLRNSIAAYSGDILIRYLCNLDIPGVGYIQVLRGNEIIHFRRSVNFLARPHYATDEGARVSSALIFSREATYAPGPQQHQRANFFSKQ